MKKNCTWCDKEFDGNKEDNCCNDDNCINKLKAIKLLLENRAIKAGKLDFLKKTLDDARGKKCLTIKIVNEDHPNFGRKHTKEALEKMRGSNSPNWKGGISKQKKLYCEKWTPELRERVRIKFHQLLGERKCFECGKLEINNIDKNGKQMKLDVHHVYYNKKMCCDDSQRLLIPLCKSCHAKTNSKHLHLKWTNHFIRKLENTPNFDGTCWIIRKKYKKQLSEKDMETYIYLLYIYHTLVL